MITTAQTQTLIDQVSAIRMMANMATLTAFQTRHCGYTNYQAVANAIKAMFAAAGLTAITQPEYLDYDYSGEPETYGLVNMIHTVAEIKGSLFPDKYIVVSAHCDSYGTFAIIGELLPFCHKGSESPSAQSYGLICPKDTLLTAPDSYELCLTEDGTYSETISFDADFEGTIYVKLNNNVSGSYPGAIAHLLPTGITRNLPVYGYIGDGTVTYPFPVSTPVQLNEVRNDMAAHYKQYCDIDLSNYADPGWVPIGSYIDHMIQTPFTGVYDGNGYSITGLVINTITGEYGYGLFGTLGTELGTLGAGAVRNLTIDNAVIIAGAECGMIAGVTRQSAVIANCTVSGSIKSTFLHPDDEYVSGPYSGCGGLIGMMLSGGYAINCHAAVSISYTETNPPASAVISIGGLVGDVDGFIWRCSSAGTISGIVMNCGGLIGYAQIAQIFDCYSTTALEVDTTVLVDASAGGLIGHANVSCYIVKCFAAGNILYPILPYVGGLIGRPDDTEGTTTVGCFWDREATGCLVSEGGVSKTTAEMRSADIYIAADYDFVNIWIAPSLASYPTLNRNNVSEEAPEI